MMGFMARNNVPDIDNRYQTVTGNAFALNKKFRSLEAKLQDHTGFMLYDLEEKKELYAFQEKQYFTPASNTKIFTLYTSLKVLGDSIPSLRYVEKGDSLIFKGTGEYIDSLPQQ